MRVALAVWLLILLYLYSAVYIFGYRDQAQPADVIVVLGAGVRPNNQPTAALRTRTRRGAELYHAGLADYVICTGAIPRVATISEAQACRSVLRDNGVPDSAIVMETQSRSTEENARYAHAIMQQRGWTSAVVVTDRYHLLRANWLFTTEGMTVYPSPSTSSYLGAFLYARSITREVIALHWQAFTDALNLPFTYVPFV